MQLERLTTALDRPAGNRPPVEFMESRIWSLTQQVAEILDRWTLSDLRHTRAIGEMEARLKDLESLKTRVEHNAEEHLRTLERKIGQEWNALQQMLEEPVRQLQEHAASLRETSVATAGSALSGLERTESRLANIQAELSDRMAQLTREVQSTLGNLRGRPPSAAQAAAGVASWPLDQVVRLHNELREAEGDGHGSADASAAPKAITLMPSVTQPVTSDPERVTDTLARAARSRRTAWIAAVILLIGGLVLAVAFALRLDREFEAAALRITEAEQRAASTRASAQTQIATSQKEAERQIAEARATALRAQMVSEVLAAPDLVRYGLSGGEAAPAARGQLLWSRSRGVVLSASRVPQAPSGSTYQLWLLTASGATSAGLTNADSQGRLSLATDEVPSVPRPVIGIAVTVEPASGTAAPSGATVLAYRPQPTERQE